MKKLLLFGILSLFNVISASGQLWQSISKVGTFETAPFRGFKIDNYTNNIWMIHDTKVAVIENDGNIRVFTDAELGALWTNDNIQFAFTPSSLYYNIDLYGLHSFNNYNSNQLEVSMANYLTITSNLDTLYITMADLGGFKKYYNGTVETFNKNFTEIDAKNTFFYGNNGSSGIYEYFEASNTISSLTSDPQYLLALYNDTKFSRNTDTFYVAGQKGISFALAYDFLDTITPNNSTAMPSANVLEIEFDMNDSLWAVFGDASDVPFAIAKLEGSTWTNRIDNLNSPIDFSTFLGLEIDTMGNLWVADQSYLHTLLSPNSPQWLSLSENAKMPSVTISPNPVSDVLTVNSSGVIDEIQVMDLQGRIVQRLTPQSKNPQIAVDTLSAGTYLLVVTSDAQVECIHFVKR